MAYTTINDPTKYFNTSLYTGDYESGGAIKKTQAIIGLGFQPDLNWIKNREPGDDWHIVTDSSRGVTKNIFPNDDADEVTHTERIKSLDSDGFTIGNDINVNTTEETFVSWNWKANGGTRTTNTESGNNPGGGYQANTTAGFSIVDYTGTGAAGTMAHGLGAVPHLIMVKRRDSSSSWLVYHHKNTSAPETDILELQASNATYDNSTYWNDTAPTSTVFTINTSSDGNANNGTYVAYCFTEIQGYSKFGGYVGNGNADGTFVYTGFKPAWIMVKETGATRNWGIADPDELQLRNGGVTNALFPNHNYGQDANERVDIYSNGFKLKTTSTTWNTSAGTFIFAAFAERPFVSSEGIPCTAR